MKPVEEAFASETFRRVVLPGIVLAIGVHPLLTTWTPSIDAVYGVGSTVLLVTEIVLFGLMVSSATQWIYYVYEGFRLKVVTAAAGRANVKRLQNLIKLSTELEAKPIRSEDEENQLSKAYEALLDFPAHKLGTGAVERYTERPTRLGNIIAVYELYAETRYGFDGVFYWFHLLSFGPEQARQDFAEQYGFAESLVLTSFSGVLVAVLHALVLIGFAIGSLFPHFVIVSLQTGPKTSFVILLAGIAVWWLFYMAALPAHREAGRIFQSMVDIAMPDFTDWINKIKAPLDQPVIDLLKKLHKHLAELS
jgi:IS1 family transposase